jgi:hypothetical protein
MEPGLALNVDFTVAFQLLAKGLLKKILIKPGMLQRNLVG